MIGLGIVAAAIMAAAIGYVWARFRELTRGVRTYRGRNVSRDQIDRYSVALNHYRAHLAGRHLAHVSAGLHESDTVAHLGLLTQDHSIPSQQYEEIGS